MNDFNWFQFDTSELPSDMIFQNPETKELSGSFTASLGKDISLPYVIKDRILMSEGLWNSYYYSSNSIEDAYKNTDWTDRTNRNLFLDHKDLETSEWVGEVLNPHIDGNSLKGDLAIYDPIIAIKMALGKPKVGVSPKVKGDVDRDSRYMKSFTFQNFSIVINPAVKNAYINNMEVQKPMAEEIVNTEPRAAVATQCDTPGATPEADMKKKKDEYPVPEKMDAVVDEASEWSDFIKKMKAKDPNMSFKQIAAEYGKISKKNEELEEIEGIKSQLAEIMSLLKAKKEEDKYPPEEAMKEKKKPEEELPVKDEAGLMEAKFSELTKKLSEIEMKVEKPDKLSVKGSGSSTKKIDSDEGMYKYLCELDGGRN